MKYENLEELLLPRSNQEEEEIDVEKTQPSEYTPLAKYFESARLLSSDTQVVERVVSVIDYFLQIDSFV